MGRAERKPATALAAVKMEEDPLMLRACRGEKVLHRVPSPPCAALLQIPARLTSSACPSTD